ncbi:threonine/homoserine/homoserine lactone efflux protein [Saccharopolyspora lacisalsi]|uniref:Threonine/homoserine/homoserine lactone efflux protein n=1 Tax=Halosaccharopolyspora lacisalsi TaxID=1000566 RepID=A0A839DTE3_9PSEU|nr:hypothetical protein [Halosaccharopolyspora lacisalsi]MBA8824313.1 threonine/homoserine/homoserine lactone efflux protein [Halosaccharopolyspora lacisalsi]
MFFATVLPRFVDRTAGPVIVRLLAPGNVFAVIAVLSDGLWALGAGAARAWFARSPQRLTTIGGGGGLAMIGLRTTLAISGRGDWRRPPVR